MQRFAKIVELRVAAENRLFYFWEQRQELRFASWNGSVVPVRLNNSCSESFLTSLQSNSFSFFNAAQACFNART